MNYLENAYRLMGEFRAKIEKNNVGLNINDLKRDAEFLSFEMQKALAEHVTPQGHPDQHFGAVTYAQHGDDLMILNLFSLIGVKLPTYLDLGAHDPEIISNTKLVYEMGSRGVNVEPNPVLFQRFVERRPEDVNLNVGVDVLPGTAPFYIYSETSGRNTFSQAEVANLEGRMNVQDRKILPVKTLKQIVDEHCFGNYPELLSCDIEGLDYHVLETMPNFEASTIRGPMVIVVETRRHETHRMVQMLYKKGFHCHVRMGENLFFVRKDVHRLVL